MDDDELAWALYDEFKRTGQYPRLEAVLNRDEVVKRTIDMCEWIMRYAEDRGKDPFTLDH